MPGNLTALAVILVVAGITFASRLSGAYLMSRIDASPKVLAFLDALSISVVAALVASIVAQHGLREAQAVIVAALVMLSLRSAVWAMIAGMVSASAWTIFAPV